MSSASQQARKIQEIADRLGVPDTWLDALINFETAGTYDPHIKNPHSSARGLVQITDARAREIGYADSLDAVTKNADFDSQMENVVYPTLKQYYPYANKQEFMMSIFYPAYRHVPPDTQFPPHVQAVNPGISTVQDYMDFVNRRIVEANLRIRKLAPALLIAVMGAGLVWLYLRRR